MSNSEERKVVAWSLISLAIIFSIIAAFTDCTAGGADNYAHFNIARWAFKYPHLFLDHWGKPVYTILVAPFTQLGFFGARFFNIICGLLTAWFCYLIASKWELKKAWLVPVFVIAAPMFFVLMFSGMTEILFAFVLICAIYLFFDNKFIPSAIVLSFIILVRTEGFIFFPIFLLALVLKRKLLAIPFLFTGFIVFSIIGKLYHFNDFFWLINKMPYSSGSNDIYGSGNWYHFLIKMPEYLGYGIIALFFLGIFVLLKDWIVEKYQINSLRFFQLLILGGCFFGYLASHSFVWWRGEMSLGLVRVMAGVSPIAGIISLIGYNRIENIIPEFRLKLLFLAFVLAFIVFPGVLRYKSEFKSDPHSVLIKKAIDWLHTTNNLKHKLIVHDPSMAFFAKVDAWDQEVVQYGFSDVLQPEIGLPDSSIFIWDSHFSHNEGRIPASRMLDNHQFELLAYFEPETSFEVLGGNNYYLMIFRKVGLRNFDNHEKLASLKDKFGDDSPIHVEILDFETAIPHLFNEKSRILSSDSISNFYYQLDSLVYFSPNINFTENQFNISNKLGFEVEFDFIFDDDFAKNDAVLVFSVEKNNKSYDYQTADLLQFFIHKTEWNKAKCHFYMPDEVEKGSQIKLYIWDVAKKKLKVDNFVVKVYSKK